MGFLKDVELKNGLSIEKAYHNIDFLAGNKENISFTITSYPSKKIFEENKEIEPLTVKQLSFVPNFELSKNIFEQAYAYLKTQEEYEDVIDV